jgi:methyltransferase of ATP-grasp peptide maturase system
MLHAPPIDQARVSGLLRGLADELVATGDLRSPEWRQAVERVPRHVFIPRFYHAISDGGPTRYARVSPASHGVDAWLAMAYRNETWVTQLDGGSPAGDEPVTGIPTSSSTLPGLIVSLLEELDVADGMTVLASGTGSGYTTALLSERLGADHVVTIDTDPGLASLARRRLRSAGYTPTVVAGNGLEGYRPAAPYDRVLSTHSVRAVPPAWLEQTRPGGVVLTTITGDLHAFGTARLTVHADGTATGTILDAPISFMVAREHAWPIPTSLRARLTGETTARDTHLSPAALDDWAFRFCTQLVLPTVTLVKTLDERDRTTAYLLDSDTPAWASVTTTEEGYRVDQAGPRRLWDIIEQAHRQWQAHGNPSPAQFELSMTPAGSQQLHLADGSDPDWQFALPNPWA